MSLSARAIAIQGVGFGPRLVALAGLWQASEVINGITGPWRRLTGEYPKPRKRRKLELPPAPSIDAPLPPPVPAPIPVVGYADSPYRDQLFGELARLIPLEMAMGDKDDLALALLLADWGGKKVQRHAVRTTGASPAGRKTRIRTLGVQLQPDPPPPLSGKDRFLEAAATMTRSTRRLVEALAAGAAPRPFNVTVKQAGPRRKDA